MSRYSLLFFALLSVVLLHGCCEPVESTSYYLDHQTESLSLFPENRRYVFATQDGETDTLLLIRSAYQQPCWRFAECESGFACEEMILSSFTQQQNAPELNPYDYVGNLSIEARAPEDALPELTINYTLLHTDSTDASQGTVWLQRAGRNSFEPVDNKDCLSVSLFNHYTFADTTFQGVMRIDDSCVNANDDGVQPLRQILISNDFGPIGYTTADGRAYELVAFYDE